MFDYSNWSVLTVNFLVVLYLALSGVALCSVLHLVSADVTTTTFERQGIYVLPETVADLPPVRGIVTAGEGNPLSHVQLLARNLGIPNVAIEERNLEKLRPYDGKEIVLAVSPGGSVRLALMDAQTSALFDVAPAVNAQPVITVDLAKLDLTKRDFINLSALRAADSGRIVGPKAAKLGELKFHYPEAVADGWLSRSGRSVPYSSNRCRAARAPFSTG